MKALMALVTALSIPLMILNMLGGIVSGIWLAILGEEFGEVAKSIIESIAVLFAWYESSTRNDLISRLQEKTDG